MENNERDRKLDQWLDEALSEYGAAEPRFGLEQRVLNRISAEERARSRKWNVWRWMPAFAAIAAIVVVAVAVRPMLEKKPPVQQFNSPIETRAAADSAKSADRESSSKKAEAVTKGANQPELQETLRQNSILRWELARVPEKEAVPHAGDRDQVMAKQGQGYSRQADIPYFEQKKPVTASNIVSADGRVKAMAPPPPPPPPVQQLQAGAVGGSAGGTGANAPAMAANETAVDVNGIAPKSKVEAANIQPAPSALLNDKVATESVASVIAKDSRRKEAHAKPEAREDANVMEVYGVRVRFDSGPSTQQFPTPVPLSYQEKLALKAGQQLKDSAVAQHKSTDITPIEIKDVEIKPLEGPEKDK
jgi:hypothetical protein